MRLKTRRILTVISVILFLILAPLIILYTFGFRYDFKEKKIVQTGIIYLTPAPQDNVKILVNGAEAKNNLSVKGFLKKDYVLYNLLPQTYEIKLQKDGYWDWKKNLSVLPGIITYAWPLLLTRNPVINPVFESESVGNWDFSPDYKKIAYLKGKGTDATIAVYDTNSQKTKSINIREILPELNSLAGSPKLAIDALDFSNNNAQIFWSPNSVNFALVLGANPARIFLFSANEIAYLTGAFIPDAVTRGQWNGSNDYFIYLTQKQELYSLGLKPSPNPQPAIANNISGFTVKNNDVYYLENNNLFIYRLSLSSPGDKKQLSFAPLNPDTGSGEKNPQNAGGTLSRLIISARNDIAIITPDKNLFLVRQNRLPSRIGSNVEAVEFSQDGGSLLYNSSFEIFIYSPGSDSENLITRSGQKISDVGWYKDYSHIWFYADSTLKNIELDSRPVPNVVNFMALPQPAENFIYDNIAGNIYYNQIDGNKISIYRVKE